MTDIQPSSQNISVQSVDKQINIANVDSLVIEKAAPKSPQSQQEYRYRQMLLRKVEQWEEPILAGLLNREVSLLLDLAERQDAIARYQNLAYESREQMRQALPAGTKVISKFDELGEGGTLLILGEPGSGKTFALVEMAVVLKERSQKDINLAIPVIFHLSTWQVSKLPIKEWIVEQFEVQYGVKSSLSESWLKHEQLILLLDGLDEVAAELRILCANMIAAFHRSYGITKMVVCCRLWEYEELQNKLPFDGALLIQPLPSTQIESYLSSLGDCVDGLRQAWMEDEVLQELAQTPLMLSVMTIAYGDLPVSALTNRSPDIETRRQDLWESYISRMCDRKSNLVYPKSKIRRWLQFLAQKMVAQSQTVFYIERMQPYWLTESQHWLYRLIFGLILGAIFGLIVQSVTGLIFGLIVEPIFRLSKQSIDPYESFALKHLDWWIFLKNLKEWLGIGLLGGILWGLIMAQIFLIYRLMIEMLLWLIMGPIFGLILGLILGLIFGLVEALRTEMIDHQVPNQGIWTSAKSILPLFLLTLSLIILGMWTIAWLIWKFNIWKLPILSLEQFIPLGMVIAIYLNFVNFGGRICIQHLALRLTLYLNKQIPWSYAKFLDYCTQLILLRRIGGGYIFVHRLLLEHIATYTPKKDCWLW